MILDGGTLFISCNITVFSWLKDIFNDCGFENVIVESPKKNALAALLNKLKPRYVFIHSEFYSCVTPFMVGCLLEKFPELNISVINFGNFPDSLAVRFIFHGAKSYLDINYGIEEFKNGLNKIKTGQVYYSPGVDRRINDFDEISKLKSKTTDREWQVLFLICNGFTDDDITANLAIGKRTVENHIYNLYKIFDVRKRGDLIRKAIYLGWVKNDELVFYGNNIKIPKQPTKKRDKKLPLRMAGVD